MTDSEPSGDSVHIDPQPLGTQLAERNTGDWLADIAAHRLAEITSLRGELESLRTAAQEMFDLVRFDGLNATPEALERWSVALSGVPEPPEDA